MVHNNYYKNDDEDLMFHMKTIDYQVYNHLNNLLKVLPLFVVVEVMMANQDLIVVDDVQMNMAAASDIDGEFRPRKL